MVVSPFQLRIEGHFDFRTFWTKFCNLLKYGMNLKFETIVQIFRKIIQLNAVINLKSTNEYFWKNFSKSDRKMDLYLAMISKKFLNQRDSVGTASIGLSSNLSKRAFFFVRLFFFFFFFSFCYSHHAWSDTGLISDPRVYSDQSAFSSRLCEARWIASKWSLAGL